MAYPALKKFYYEDEALWKNEYTKRFNAPFTEHFDFQIRQYNYAQEFPAFLCYTREITALIDNIHALNFDLQYVVRCLPEMAIKQYLQVCMIEEIQASNEIEGVRSSRKEIKMAWDYVQSNNTAAGVRFQSVVSKYQKLLAPVRMGFMTSVDIRKFYDEFIYDEVNLENPNNLPDGEIFRAGQVEITGGTQKVLHMGAFPEDKLIQDMDKALNLLNDTQIVSAVRIAVFHYLFGYLHPFYDGNGRTVRFITSYFLAKYLSPLIALNISLIIKHDRGSYYKMFKETNAYINCGDLGLFVTEFLRIIEQAAKQTVEYLKKQSRLYEAYLEKIAQLPEEDKLTLSLYDVLLQAALFSADGVTMQDLAKVLKKSRNTVAKRLEKFPSEYLLIDKSSRQYQYKLNISIWK